MIDRIDLRLRAMIILAGCGLALGMALTAEHVFGLAPCPLCLIERLPFVAAGLMAAVALLAPARPVGLRRVAMGVAAVALLVNSGIAFYHVGVEQGWWLSSCSSGALPEFDLGNLDLAAQINSLPTAQPNCDSPAFVWHGVTFALLNVFYSAFLSVLSFLFSLLRYTSRREIA